MCFRAQSCVFVRFRSSSCVIVRFRPSLKTVFWACRKLKIVRRQAEMVPDRRGAWYRASQRRAHDQPYSCANMARQRHTACTHRFPMWLTQAFSRSMCVGATCCPCKLISCPPGKRASQPHNQWRHAQLTHNIHCYTSFTLACPADWLSTMSASLS